MHHHIRAAVLIVARQINDDRNIAVHRRRARVAIVAAWIDNQRGIGTMHVIPGGADNHQTDRRLKSRHAIRETRLGHRPQRRDQARHSIDEMRICPRQPFAIHRAHHATQIFCRWRAAVERF